MRLHRAAPSLFVIGLVAASCAGSSDAETSEPAVSDSADEPAPTEPAAAQLISNSSGLIGLFPDPVFAPYICQYIADGTLQDCASSNLHDDGR